MGERTPEGQSKKGHLLHDSPSDVKRKRGSDGTSGGQKTIGHLDEGSENAETRSGRSDGFERVTNADLHKGEPPEPQNPSRQGDRIGGQPLDGGDE